MFTQDVVKLTAEELQFNITQGGHARSHGSWRKPSPTVQSSTLEGDRQRKCTSRTPRTAREVRGHNRGSKIRMTMNCEAQAAPGDTEGWEKLLRPSAPASAMEVLGEDPHRNTSTLSAVSAASAMATIDSFMPSTRSNTFTDNKAGTTTAQAWQTGADVLEALSAFNEDSMAQLEAKHMEAAELAVVQAATQAAIRAETAGRGRTGSSDMARKRRSQKNRLGDHKKKQPLMEKQRDQEKEQKRLQEALQVQQQEANQRQQMEKNQEEAEKEAAKAPSKPQPRQAIVVPNSSRGLKASMVHPAMLGKAVISIKRPVGNQRQNSSGKAESEAARRSSTLSADSVKSLNEEDGQQNEAVALTLHLPSAPVQEASPRRQSMNSVRAQEAATNANILAEAMANLAGVSGTASTGGRRMSVGQRMSMTGARTRDLSVADELAQVDAVEVEGQAAAGAEEAGAGKVSEEALPVEMGGRAELIGEPTPKAKVKWKVIPKSFEAPLCSFQELVNVENVPTPLCEAVDRFRNVYNGQNFTWERSRGAYGGRLNITFPIILWYQHSWDNEIKKSKTSCPISFLHMPGCAFVYQPVVPLTTLIIEPKQIYRPMFEFDPRSFHVFKLAWRHYLDFGSTDYRAIVGEQLERWTQRCKQAIEKPFNAVYWLMLMVGSHYRETLAARRVVKAIKEPSVRVPVICIDSFVALSALIFSPERQVLFAGVDPTPSYLRWLQYIADQHFGRKDLLHRHSEKRTVFEMNEFFDLPVIIIFYGRPQVKARETSPLSWVNSPTLVKSYIARYSEDNKCARQLELATRLYTYSCSLGCQAAGRDQEATSDEDKKQNDDGHWYTWNGLRVCEIGVPMPNTQASFLSPFITTRQVAVLCPVHGPDAAQNEKSKKREKTGTATGGGSGGAGGTGADQEEPDVHPGRVDGAPPSAGAAGHLSSTFSARARPSFGTHSLGESTFGSEDSDRDEEDQTESSTPRSGRESRSTLLSSVPAAGASATAGGGARAEKPGGVGTRDALCTCGQYVTGGHASEKASKKDKQGRQQEKEQVAGGPENEKSSVDELRQALTALGEYDLLHTFAAVLAGGLNLAKMVVRLHFSIDPRAYENLPQSASKTWQDSLLPWYREFHRTDIYCRSRYGMLLAAVLRGMLGDGFTSGLHNEALDLLRTNATDQPQPEVDKIKFLQQATAKSGAKKSVGSVNLSGLHRPSMFGIGMGRTSSMFNLEADEKEKPQQPSLQPKDGEAPPSADAKEGPKKDKPTKSILGNMQVWCELLGSESPVDHKIHLEVFHQWCHSAHLVPFIRRCYRRCGIAGLAPGQHVGGHKHGTDPFHPLVLPTVPDFCYGHCYPLHKVLQYFYGGTEQIVCSIDDQKAVEADKAGLGLIAGQERLNNQCWFQVNEEPEVKYSREESPQRSKSRKSRTVAGTNGKSDKHGGKLDQNMLQELEAYMSSSASPGRDKLQNAVRRSYMIQPAQGWSQHKAGSGLALRHQSTSKMSSDDEEKKNQNRMTIKRKAPHIPTLKPQLGPLGPGEVSAEDPFFWFCHGDFSLYTYPASQVPRRYLHDPTALNFQFSDFVSRSGTPIRRSLEGDGGATGFAADDVLAVAATDAWEAAPPSICLCQPTELTSHVRTRWEVKMDFADDEKLLLGDTGWFPGALGHRFTFEARTDDVQRYVLLSSMPQASLVYLEHVRRPPKKKDKGSGKAMPHDRKKPGLSGEESASSSSESEEDYDPSVPAHKFRLPYFYRRSKNRNGVSTQKVGRRGVDLMLPPLEPT